MNNIDVVIFISPFYILNHVAGLVRHDSMNVLPSEIKYHRRWLMNKLKRVYVCALMVQSSTFGPEHRIKDQAKDIP